MKARKKHASHVIVNDVGTSSKCWLLLQISHNVKDEKRQMRNLSNKPIKQKARKGDDPMGPSKGSRIQFGITRKACHSTEAKLRRGRFEINGDELTRCTRSS